MLLRQLNDTINQRKQLRAPRITKDPMEEYRSDKLARIPHIFSRYSAHIRHIDEEEQRSADSEGDIACSSDSAHGIRATHFTEYVERVRPPDIAVVRKVTIRRDHLVERITAKAAKVVTPIAKMVCRDDVTS